MKRTIIAPLSTGHILKPWFPAKYCCDVVMTLWWRLYVISRFRYFILTSTRAQMLDLISLLISALSLVSSAVWVPVLESPFTPVSPVLLVFPVYKNETFANDNRVMRKKMPIDVTQIALYTPLLFDPWEQILEKFDSKYNNLHTTFQNVGFKMAVILSWPQCDNVQWNVQ